MALARLSLFPGCIEGGVHVACPPLEGNFVALRRTVTSEVTFNSQLFGLKLNFTARGGAYLEALDQGRTQENEADLSTHGDGVIGRGLTFELTRPAVDGRVLSEGLGVTVERGRVDAALEAEASVWR